MPTASSSETPEDQNVPTTAPRSFNLLETIGRDKYDIFESVARSIRRKFTYPVDRYIRLIRSISTLYEQHSKGKISETLYVLILENILSIGIENDIPLAKLLREKTYRVNDKPDDGTTQN